MKLYKLSTLRANSQDTYEDISWVAAPSLDLLAIEYPNAEKIELVSENLKVLKRILLDEKI